MHVLLVVLCHTVALGNSSFYIQNVFMISFEGFHRVERSIIVWSWQVLLVVVSFEVFIRKKNNPRIILIVYESTVIIPVFGVVEIIAHFKVGMKDWIHIALVSMNVQVARKAGISFTISNDRINATIHIDLSLWR